MPLPLRQLRAMFSRGRGAFAIRRARVSESVGFYRKGIPKIFSKVRRTGKK